MNAAASRFSSKPLAGLCVALAVAALGLAGCDRRSQSNPGSTPAAIGSGTAPSGRTDAGTPSVGVETTTPGAPDTRGGGSTGPKGAAPTADTSGGPYSGSNSPGASSSTAAPAGASASSLGASSASGSGTGAVAPSATTNGGAPASALGNSASSGMTNSTPQSATGNR